MAFDKRAVVSFIDVAGIVSIILSVGLIAYAIFSYWWCELWLPPASASSSTRGHTAVWELRGSLSRRPRVQIFLLGWHTGPTAAAGDADAGRRAGAGQGLCGGWAGKGRV